MSPRLVYEASDVARFCHADVAMVYAWVKRGELSHFKTPGGRLRFKRDVLIDFLRRHQYNVPEELTAGRPKITVIDPDATAMERTRRALYRLFDLESHTDPVDGLLAIGRAKPDAVVLDTDLSPLDGLHFLHRITHFGDAPYPRVVVFTSRADALAVMDAGAAGYVQKPGLDALTDKLRGLFGMTASG